MTVELFILPGIPLVSQGDDLVALIADAVAREEVAPCDGDIFVIAQKIVSKAEGRMVDLSTIEPTARAIQIAATVEKDPRFVQLVLSEATSIVLAKPGNLIVEHKLGFVMPCAGVDQSNIGLAGHALLLPADPDASAATLRDRLSIKFRADVAVVINDSVSRPWRNGTCGIAIGAAGLPVLNVLIGMTDMFGRKMQFSITGVADEIAAAASLVMGQRDEGTPVVMIRGLTWNGASRGAYELVRRPSVVCPELVKQIT